MKRLSRAEAERQLRNPGERRGALLDTLQRLPDDVDPHLAAGAALSLVASHEYHPAWVFARRCRKLPPPVLRALLEKLPSLTPRRWWAVFLLEAVRDGGDDAALTGAFLTALDALLDVQTTYAWGSKQRRAKLKALASSPRFLPAIQAAVVGDERAPLDLLAVLAADGSEASVDALVPCFSRAHQERSGLLDWLERLKTHAAKTQAMDTLLASVRARLQERNDTSPALDFARSLGLDVAKLSVRVSLGSTALTAGHVPRVQGSVTLDSTSATWLSVHLAVLDGPTGTVSGGTSFTNEKLWGDQLELGGCDAAGLPRWLARAQKRLGITWSQPPSFVGGTLRGKKRDAFVAWLFGPSRARGPDAEPEPSGSHG
ncbi:MAG: hypothetical protein AMXMBFR34_28570 [Myxococcaceae bacterium]